MVQNFMTIIMGGLYGDLTVENTNNVINPPVRNKDLVRILEEMKELENRNSGIATMIREMRELRLEPPVFKNERGNFTVIFKNHNLMTKDDQQWPAILGVELTENEAYSLVFIRKNEKITNGDYQKINNVNRDKALNELKGLIWKGLIKSQGLGSGTYYVLSGIVKPFEQISLDMYDNQESRLTIQDDDIPPKITTYHPR